MKFIVFVLLSLAPMFAYSQAAGGGDTMPKPDFDLNAYMQSHVHYPEKAMRKHWEGKVSVKFVVNEDGSVSDVEVLKSVKPVLDKEAVRVVREMPHWIPGTKGGKPVKVRYTLPVAFKLN
jgi:periplasmic protein TonB